MKSTSGVPMDPSGRRSVKENFYFFDLKMEQFKCKSRCGPWQFFEAKIVHERKKIEKHCCALQCFAFFLLKKGNHPLFGTEFSLTSHLTKGVFKVGSFIHISRQLLLI